MFRHCPRSRCGARSRLFRICDMCTLPPASRLEVQRRHCRAGFPAPQTAGGRSQRGPGLHRAPADSGWLPVLWGLLLSLPPWPQAPSASPHGATGRTAETVGTEFGAYTDQGARQETARTGVICLFKHRASSYVQICTYLHRTHTRGWLAGDGSLSFGPGTQQILGLAGFGH